MAWKSCGRYSKKVDYEDIAFLDDNAELKLCDNYLAIGTSCNRMNHPDADFVVAIGNAKIRQNYRSRLKMLFISLH